MIFPATAYAKAGAQLEHDLAALLIEHGIAYSAWQDRLRQEPMDDAANWRCFARVTEIERRITALATGWRDACESERELACPHCQPEHRCPACMADGRASAQDRAVDIAKERGL